MNSAVVVGSVAEVVDQVVAGVAESVDIDTKELDDAVVEPFSLLVSRDDDGGSSLVLDEIVDVFAESRDIETVEFDDAVVASVSKLVSSEGTDDKEDDEEPERVDNTVDVDVRLYPSVVVGNVEVVDQVVAGVTELGDIDTKEFDDAVEESVSILVSRDDDCGCSLVLDQIVDVFAESEDVDTKEFDDVVAMSFSEFVSRGDTDDREDKDDKEPEEVDDTVVSCDDDDTDAKEDACEEESEDVVNTEESSDKDDADDKEDDGEEELSDVDDTVAPNNEEEGVARWGGAAPERGAGQAMTIEPGEKLAGVVDGVESDDVVREWKVGVDVVESDGDAGEWEEVVDVVESVGDAGE